MQGSERVTLYVHFLTRFVMGPCVDLIRLSYYR